MKKYCSIIGVALAALAITSCSKDTEGVTGITYYPVIELDGPIYDQAPAGHAYVDPGYSASLNGEDYTQNVKVTSALDFADPKPGYYSISYSAVNSDGFSATATRYVLVAEADDKASGYYSTDPTSFRVASGNTVYYGDSYFVYVAGNGDGTYEVSDLLAGWYEYRAGYGSSYALGGELAIADDGTVSLVDSYLPGWGDSADDLTDGSFDAATGTISYLVQYAGMEFHVTMVKD